LGSSASLWSLVKHLATGSGDAMGRQVRRKRRDLVAPPPRRCDKSGVIGADLDMSSRVDVVRRSRPAGDLELSSGVGPALHPDQPVACSWPPHNYLEFAALPTAVACARLHARNVLWEWGLDWLAPDAELLVAELMTNAVKATVARDDAAVRLRLSSDGAQVLIEVWDADPLPPPAADRGEDGRPDPQPATVRGLFLVAALSARWDWYLTQEPKGKVVWCQLEALTPAARSPEHHEVGCQAGTTPRANPCRASGVGQSAL
jgi:anti-sigma regulatory factor (Ser/Thr protein kinase)